MQNDERVLWVPGLEKLRWLLSHLPLTLDYVLLHLTLRLVQKIRVTHVSATFALSFLCCLFACSYWRYNTEEQYMFDIKEETFLLVSGYLFCGGWPGVWIKLWFKNMNASGSQFIGYWFAVFNWSSLVSFYVASLDHLFIPNTLYQNTDFDSQVI